MATWIIGILVLGGLVCAGRSVYRSHKNGGHDCGAGCGDCGGCGGCRASQPPPEQRGQSGVVALHDPK